MKKLIFLTLAIMLSVIGCAKQQEAPQQPQENPQPQQSAQATAETPKAQTWHFAVRTETQKNEYKADDGTVVAARSYEQPLLTLVNEDGETFTGSTPEQGVTAEQLAACKAFNDATASTGLWEVDLEEQGREIYALRAENNEEMPPVGEEVTVSEVYQNGDLLSVLAADYIYLGGAHPDNGLQSWIFDLAKGEFVSLWSLTDRPDELKQTLIYAIGAQISASEEADGFFENWYETLSQKDDFNVFFHAEGMTVWFQAYDLGPYALGIPQFEIPYGTISRFLNAYGEQLLDLPAEARVIGDFHEAQELWSWLDSGAPVDDSDKQNAEIGGVTYELYRLNSPGVNTISDLSDKLSRYVDKAFVDAQLAKTDQFRELDGKLYVYIAGRGDDLTIASVDYEAQMGADGKGGKVIATIHRQDNDDATGAWKLTGAVDTHEFPFTLYDGHAVFDRMEYLY